MGILSRMISFTLVKNGEDGKPGPMPHNMGEWNKNVEYIKDDYIQPYVWKYQETKKMYYLLVADRSKGDDPYLNNTQGSGNIWRYNEKYDLLLARKIQADEINTDSLVAKSVRTSTTGPRVEIQGSTIDVFGVSAYPNIRFGVDDKGYAVLTYYDNNGLKLYDLGPGGLKNINYAPAKYTELLLYKLCEPIEPDVIEYSDVDEVTWDSISTIHGTKFYTYYAGGKPNVTSEDREREKYTYTGAYSNSSKIEDGWYFFPRGVKWSKKQLISENTYEWIKPNGENGLYENSLFGVQDKDPIYFESIYLYKGGIRVSSKKVFWNDRFSNDPGQGGIPRFGRD